MARRRNYDTLEAGIAAAKRSWAQTGQPVYVIGNCTNNLAWYELVRERELVEVEPDADWPDGVAESMVYADVDEDGRTHRTTRHAGSGMYPTIAHRER